ncbi:MAG: hypothetical protein IPO45_15110 [Saprospiraceae bacterium]|jgi:hypothetical protein|nr:hypothetical protein [Candidatus Brachybacter algidus]MBK8357285.1 hypothetical protein [Candidatus Brachybacter algidus]MBK8843588.1 hypothetical protein [Candidatus Brachybacter algidus]MBK9025964.1 hypothetical protein [Candidatus Brachybacter algidus]MBK9553486.1 hypothetical protein [Candidatus Brachybacter algidus]MBL0120631.1 hypothetical protein [Candidatus Brachybacter algidus]
MKKINKAYNYFQNSSSVLCVYDTILIWVYPSFFVTGYQLYFGMSGNGMNGTIKNILQAQKIFSS